MRLDNELGSELFMFASDSCMVKVFSAKSYEEESTIAKEVKKRVNMHDELVEALESALELAESHDIYGVIHLEQKERWEKINSILEKAKS